MKKTKKLLCFALAMALVFNTLAIGTSAVLGDGRQLSVDIDLEVGTYSGTVWTPLAAGAVLKANDVITVRICPESDFLCGVSRYVVMFSSSYFEIAGSGRAAFTPNYSNVFYQEVASDYNATTDIPVDAWPASMVANGDYNTYTAVAVNNQASSNSSNGGYPGYLPGDWLFRFNLTVTQDITVGSNARIWMDSRWVRTPSYPTASSYFVKCTDANELSTMGSSTIYNFDTDMTDADIVLPTEAVSSTITFDSAGGTAVASITGNVGDTVTAPAAPTKTGYTFTGWNPALPATFPEGGLSTTAQWSINSYLITFNANGGTGGTSSSMPYGATLTAPTVTKTGYTFNGWLPAVPATVPASNKTFTAQWKVNSYTITFDANGGTGGTSSSMQYGTALTAPAVTRTGYTLAGWSPSVPSTVPAANTTYTAQWTINSYNITFDANGGMGGTNASMQYGAALTAPTVTRTGYTFNGWTPAVPSTVPAANTTYTAQWTAGNYTITFDANGGTGGTSTSLTYGAALTPPPVTRKGYTFISWSPAVPATVPAANTTYTAQWSINTYNAIFKVDGATVATVPTVYGEQIAAPADPAKAGYTFTGWSPAVGAMDAGDMTFNAVFAAKTYNAIFMVDGDVYAVVQIDCGQQITEPPAPVKFGYTFSGWSPAVGVMGAGDETFTAVFVVKTYNAVFMVDGVVYATVPTEFNKPIQAPPNPTKTGYIFSRWNPSLPLVMPASNTTYTAQWTRGYVIIYFDVNGGSGGSSGTYYYGDTINAPVVLRTGYNFSGWYLDREGTQPCTMFFEYKGETVTLYAKWTVNTYNAVFKVNGAVYAVVPTDFGASISPPANPVMAGYTFAGWSPAVGTMGAGDMVFNSLWNPKSYTITFDANGGTGGTGGIMNCGDALAAPDVKRTGYTFAGWSPAVPSTVPAADTTYTAQWTVNTYNAIFCVDGEVYAVVPTAYGAYIVPPVNPVKAGYTFYGWNNFHYYMGVGDETFDAIWMVGYTVKVYTQNTEMTDYVYTGGTWLGLGIPGEKVTATIPDYEHFTYEPLLSTSSGFVEEDGSLVLSLYYSRNICTVSIYVDGEEYASVSQPYDTGMDAPADPVKPGYTFLGWFDGSGRPFGFPLAVLDDYTLYARFSGNTYTAVFLVDGETYASVPTVIGDTIAVPADPAKTGYTFAGWSPVPGTMGAGDETFNALWTINRYTIAFDANGGTGGTSNTMNFGAALTAPVVTRTGFTFAGWSPAVPSKVPALNITYTAQWTVNSYTIAFDANSGIGSTSGSMQYGAVLTPPVVTKTGYTLIGWSPALPATVPAADTTYTAIWQINRCTITFNSAGGSAVAPITQNYGTAVTAPAPPAKAGYIFGGWTPALPAVMGAEDLTLTALWTPAQVTFTVNGGSGPVGSDIVVYIDISANSGLAAADLFLTFDNTKLAFKNGVAGSAVADGYTSIFAQTPAGNSTIIKQSFVSGDGITAAGSLFILTFTIKAGWMGETPLVLTAGDFYDQEYSPLTLSIVNGTIVNTTPLTYTITFDANGGTGGTSTVMDCGSPLTAPVVTRTGYTFLGWSPEVPATVPGEDTTYTALWQINSYILTFDANGGTGSLAPSAQEYGSVVTLPAGGFTKTGYTFIGWNTNPAATRAFSYYTVLAEDVTLYAIYRINTYNAFFYVDGVLMATVPTVYGAAIAAPADPTKTGYTFTGWSPAVGIMGAGDMTFNAQFTVKICQATFIVDGRVIAIVDTLPGSIPVSPGNPTKIGYTFIGWSPTIGVIYESRVYTALFRVNTYNAYFKVDGAVYATVPTDYGQQIIAPSDPAKTGYTFTGWTPSVGIMDAWDTVFNAKWTVNSYTITWDAAGGEGGTITSVAYGTVPTPPTVTKTGYTFTGWSPAIVAVTGDATYYAMWTSIKYTIIWDPRGGTWFDGSKWSITTTAQYGELPSLPFPGGVTRLGYTFNGWSPAIAHVTGNATYSAQWQVNSYTITFDANGGTGGTSTLMEYRSPLSAPVVAKTGYTFIGWSPVVPATVPAQNTTYTAQWQVNSYTITFDANGGTGGTSAAMEYGSPLTPPVVAKTGYTFIGWTPDVPASVPSHDATYVAQWSRNEYRIIFNCNGGYVFFDGFLYYGEPLTAPPVCIRTGYTFIGWSPAVPATVPAADTTYTAQWQINSYTVTFDANGGTGGTTTSVTYSTIPTPPTVTRTGYTFIGWAPELVPVTADATYTALWEKIPVTLGTQSGSTAIIDTATHTIYGLAEGLTAANFINNFMAISGDGTLNLTFVNGSFGTGTKVELVDNETGLVMETYYIVIFGDVDGDGRITAADASQTGMAASYRTAFEEGSPFMAAADVTRDGIVDAFDLNIIRAATLGYGDIDQVNPEI